MKYIIAILLLCIFCAAIYSAIGLVLDLRERRKLKKSKKDSEASTASTSNLEGGDKK